MSSAFCTDHAAAVARYLSVQDGRWKLLLPAELAAVYVRGIGGYALAVSDEEVDIFSILPFPRARTC